MKTSHVHFMGIAGSGASAVAAIAKEFGFKVSGCDSNITQEFTQFLDIKDIHSGHSPSHLEGVDILAITPAVTSLDPENSELQEARKRGVEVLNWQEFMGKYLEKDKTVIAVCGTHGKSTTTAMISCLLEDSNLDPTVELGAVIPRWGKNYRVGRGKYFITEADEFNDNYLASKPDIAVVTNIEMDHPEYFKNFEDYKQSFIKFLSSVKKLIIANLSDQNVGEVMKVVMKQSAATCIDYSKHEFALNLKVEGEHNNLNAKAAFQVGLSIGVPLEKIKESLIAFTGIGRRFEYLGKYKNAKVFSDFGHHPTEIKATISAARKKFPDERIVLVYQPHMFSRTKALFDQFVKTFRSLPVEKIALMDIYPSREIDTGLVRSSQIAESADKETITYEGPEELKETIEKEGERGSILFFMGAGDIDLLARKLVEKTT